MSPSTSPPTPATRAYYPLVLVVCALSAGICFDRVLPLTMSAWWLLALLLACAWLFCGRFGRHGLASCLLLGAISCVGAARHHWHWRLYTADEISLRLSEIPQPCYVEAVALEMPRWIPAPIVTPLRAIPETERSELLVQVVAVRHGSSLRPASGRAQLTVAGKKPVLRAGDRLSIYAQASRPAETRNPGEFNFASYERCQRVSCRLFAEFPECVEVTARGGVFSPRRWLADLRSGGLAVLHRHIDPERATLASAILLGAREQLDTERNEDYLATGTIHVLSISGLHVSILAASFFTVLRLGLMPRRLTLIATAGLTVAYALLVDFEAPVVRAAVLVVVVCLSLWSGRQSVDFNTLALAGVIVLALNPTSLFQAGPQLSFLALITMISFRRLLVAQPVLDPLDRLIARTRPWPIRQAKRLGGGLWRLWLTGALIWIVSLPLIWHRSHLISPAALVLNLLSLLPVSLAMHAGFVTLVLGGVAPTIAGLAGACCDQCLSALEQIVRSGRTWPASHFWLPAPPTWWVVLFYAGATVCCVLPRLRPKPTWMMAAALAWATGACVLSQWGALRSSLGFERPLRCDFISVGHGLSVLIELPSGRNVLYDAGRLGSPLAAVRPISSVLWSRGISHLDAIIVSHADIDHFNAIPDLLDRFSVGAVYVPPTMFRRQAPAVVELQRSFDARGIVVRHAFQGLRLNTACGAVLKILHPPPSGIMGSDNANSIVLVIEHQGCRILLTGDLETPGLEELLIRQTLPCNVVLAPHHGSLRSNPSQFADWSRPQHVVISGSLSLSNRSTTQRVIESFRLAGAEVYHTADDGCVRAEIRGNALSLATHRRHVRATPLSAATNFLQSE